MLHIHLLHLYIATTSSCVSTYRGDSLTLQKGPVTPSTWRDNKVFIVMSTCRQPNEHGSVLRRPRDGTRISLPCPAAIVSYNTYMGGVDRSDQLRGYYSCRSKSRKFYKYIFYFLLDTAVTNAYIMYTHYTESPTFKTVKDFRASLAKSLIGNYCSWRRPGRGGTTQHSIPLTHFPRRLMETSGANVDTVLPVQTKEKEMTAGGGARSVKCGCVTQVCQILTASCSGTNTYEKNNGTDCISTAAGRD